jgi:hypothetical protein
MFGYVEFGDAGRGHIEAGQIKRKGRQPLAICLFPSGGLASLLL